MNELIASFGRVVTRPRAVLLCWSTRMLFALLLTLPIWQLVAGSGIADHPDGDAVLFRAGALHLSELLRLMLPELTALARISPFVVALVGVVALIPLAALMVALDSDEPLSTRDWLGDAAAHLPRFTLVAGFTLLLQALLLFVTITVAVQVREAMSDPAAQRSADLWGGGVGLLGLGLLATFGVLGDLARAAVVRRGARALESIGIALSTLTSRPLATLSSWGTPAAWSLVLVLAGAWLSGRIDVSHGGAGRVLAVAVVHQVVLVALVVLRGTWLDRALALTDRA